MEKWTFAEVREFASQYGLDVLWLAGHEVAAVAENVEFDYVRTFWFGVTVDALVKVKEPIVDLRFSSLIERRKACQWSSTITNRSQDERNLQLRGFVASTEAWTPPVLLTLRS